MYVRDVTNIAQLKTLIDWILRQVSNNTGSTTLRAGYSTTVVENAKCTSETVVVLSPQTADAANEMSSTYVTTTGGSFTINHPNNSNTNRKFGYVLIKV